MWVALGGTAVLCVVGVSGASAAVVKAPIELVSYDTGGGYGDGASTGSSVSNGMRQVAFLSIATDLGSPGSDFVQAYVRDRQTGALELISVDTTGSIGQGNSTSVAISADGRFVAFTSDAPEIVAGVTPTVAQAYLRDRVLGTTTLLSIDTIGDPAAAQVANVDIDDSGDTVVFETSARLTAEATHAVEQVFVWDAGAVSMASVDPATGDGGTIATAGALISPGGDVVGMSSSSQLSSAPAGGGQLEAYARFLSAGTTVMMSTSADGMAAADAATSALAVLDDGRGVVSTGAQNLTSGLILNPARQQIFRVHGALPASSSRAYDLVSHTAASTITGGDLESYDAAMSNDGEYIVFSSRAQDLTTIPLSTAETELFSWEAATGVVTGETPNVSDPTRTGFAKPFSLSTAPDGSGYGFQSESKALTATTRDATDAQNQVFVGFRGQTVADPPGPGVDPAAPAAGSAGPGGASTAGRGSLANTGAGTASAVAGGVMVGVLALGAAAVGVSRRRRQEF